MGWKMRILRKWKELCLAAALAFLAAQAGSLPALADDTYCDRTLGMIVVDNLRVHNDRTCTLNGTTVMGNITVENNATLNAYGVVVGGNIQADKANWVGVYSNSLVGGSIQIKSSDGAKIDSTFTDGDLQAFDNRGLVTITYNTIDGNLQCTGNQPAPIGGGNVVSGSMENQCANFDRPPALPTATPLPTATSTPIPSGTPVPPAASATPTNTKAQPDATKVTPVAVNDQYALSGTQISISKPGILANDTIGKGPAEVILVKPASHGILILGQDGSFSYQVTNGYYGEDSFEYKIKVTGVESNIAVVRLLMNDQQSPTVVWTAPVVEGERYVMEEGEVVSLEVTASDDSLVTEVTFWRWDAFVKDYFVLSRLTQPPFRTEVQASDLNVGWNQIYANATDVAGNSSDFPSIWLYKPAKVYLPVVGKEGR